MTNYQTKQHLNKASLLFLFADLSVIASVYILSIQFLHPIAFETHLRATIFLFITLVLVWFFSETTYKLYAEDRLRTILMFDISTLTKGVFFMEIAIILVIYLRNKPFLPHSFVLIFPFVVFIALSIEKYLALQLVRYLRKNGFNIRHIVILGNEENAVLFYQNVRQNLNLGYNVLGYFGDKEQPELPIPYLGQEQQLEEFLSNNHVNELVITYSEVSTSEIAAVTYSADRFGVRVRIIPNFLFLYERKYEFWQLGKIPTFTLRREPLEKMTSKAFKRTFDVVFSAFVLVFICSWLFPIIALLIRINSKGPILFRQMRMGRDRKEFVCYKFRSMYVNDDADKVMATKQDARITPIGAFLRKTSIDEFPQFWNVLIGNMSIVGPRPHMSLHNQQYQEKIDNYLVRQLVRPGITGWAQVHGYRGEIKTDKDIKKRVEYDIWYIENWSFTLDLKIILMTVWSVFSQKGNAY